MSKNLCIKMNIKEVKVNLHNFLSLELSTYALNTSRTITYTRKKMRKLIKKYRKTVGYVPRCNNAICQRGSTKIVSTLGISDSGNMVFIRVKVR